MHEITNAALIEKAVSVLRPRQDGEYVTGNVGCALVTAAGRLYLGVCIETSSSMGFCAEHSAIAAMVAAGEYRIQTIVAVCKDGAHTYILPPCGRCREFIYQIDHANIDTQVILDIDKVVTLADLLPYHDWFQKLQE